MVYIYSRKQLRMSLCEDKILLTCETSHKQMGNFVNSTEWHNCYLHAGAAGSMMSPAYCPGLTLLVGPLSCPEAQAAGCSCTWGTHILTQGGQARTDTPGLVHSYTNMGIYTHTPGLAHAHTHTHMRTHAHTRTHLGSQMHCPPPQHCPPTCLHRQGPPQGMVHPTTRPAGGACAARHLRPRSHCRPPQWHSPRWECGQQPAPHHLRLRRTGWCRLGLSPERCWADGRCCWPALCR